MIAATVRASLNQQDIALACQLLAAAGAEQEELAERVKTEGPDVLWDDPRLLKALLSWRGIAQPSAPLFFYVALRRQLLELGVDDRDVTDYCAALVLAFGRGDRAYRTGAHDENRYHYLVDLVEEADRAEGERQFRVRLHLGNFSLWLTGIFPDYIAARRVRKGGPPLPYYEGLGRTGFQLASDHRLAESYGLADVLRTAAERFFELRVALNRLSDHVMFPGAGSVDRLLRQVADGLRARERGAGDRGWELGA
ncbi:MAG TPA: hypothetical protein VNL98_01950 [Gemmatimonadales bacterium]|nr:hypothetical protein [Gemmatimonadales bacterium]